MYRYTYLIDQTDWYAALVKVMIKVQSQKVGLTSYQFTSFWFHVNQPSHSWDGYFKIWLWKSKVKVIFQGHTVDPTSYWLQSFLFHVNTLPFLRYGCFNIWPWKSKVKVTQWVQHPINSHPFCSMSNPSHPWDTVISKFDLRKSMLEIQVQGHIVGPTSYWLNCSLHANRPLIP